MVAALRRATLALLAAFALAASAPDALAQNATNPAASTVGGARVLEVLRDIESTLVDSRYSPVTRVNPKQGLYEFDCSGMASWVLRRASPGAWQRVRARSLSGRLVARDFFRTIAAVAPDKPHWAWQRVARIEDAQPGDVVAWLKPPGWRSAVTGHVGFVVSAPVPSRRIQGGYLVRFADASRYRHQDDTRAATGRDGFGSGTILLIADPATGAPGAYGWFGDDSSWISETEIVIGRPRR
jgi:hypothetical protein